MAVVAVITLEQDIFSALRTLIIANKPSYTYNNIVYTYTLEATYPKDNPSFPIVVLNESSIKVIPINLDGSGEDFEVEVQLDFYAKELHGKKAISVGRDGLRNTFIGNRVNFDTNNGLLFQENFWDDSNVSAFEDRNQIVNTASSIIKFILK